MPVNEEQATEEAELSNRIVRRVDSLETFFTSYTDTDIGSLNHRDIIGAITNCQAHGAETFLDKFDD